MPKDEVINDTEESVKYVRSLNNEDKVHASIVRNKKYNLNYMSECLRNHMTTILIFILNYMSEYLRNHMTTVPIFILNV